MGIEKRVDFEPVFQRLADIAHAKAMGAPVPRLPAARGEAWEAIRGGLTGEWQTSKQIAAKVGLSANYVVTHLEKHSAELNQSVNHYRAYLWRLK